MIYAGFLFRQEPNSPWLQIMFEEEFDIIKTTLYSFASKKFRPSGMAYIMDRLVTTYLRSHISNHTKFEFGLELLKFVIQKAPVLFGFMKCTNEIQDNQTFLEWFFLTELRPDKQ